MDSDFGEAIDHLKKVAKAATEDVGALEQSMGDAIEIRAHLDRLCGQLTEIHAILAGDAEQEKEGLLKRFGRWSRLVRADLRQLNDEERQLLRERILVVEHEALAELKVDNPWTEKLLEELRKKLATAKRVELTDRALAKICQDIDKLREYVCRSSPTPRRQKLNLILRGVHGTIKIVADVGRLAGDPTIVMGLCGVFSVYSGGKMVGSAVQGLRRMETNAARAASDAEAKKQRADAENRASSAEAEEEKARQGQTLAAERRKRLVEGARKTKGKYKPQNRDNSDDGQNKDE